MKIEGQKRYRAFLILMAYLIMVMSGIRNGTTYFENTSHEFLYIMVLALTLTNICIVDGKITGKPLSIFSYWIVFIFYGIAVPVCIIRTHGIKGIPLVLLHSLGHVNSYFTLCVTEISYDFHCLERIVCHGEDVQVLRRDVAVITKHCFFDPFYKAVPVFGAHQHNREGCLLERLNQNERFEELVHCSVASGEDNEAVSVFKEHYFAHEEIPEHE